MTHVPVCMLTLKPECLWTVSWLRHTSLMPGHDNSASQPLVLVYLCTYAGLCMKDAWGRLYHCDKPSLVTTAFSLSSPRAAVLLSLFRNTEAWIINEFITSHPSISLLQQQCLPAENRAGRLQWEELIDCLPCKTHTSHCWEGFTFWSQCIQPETEL